MLKKNLKLLMLSTFVLLASKASAQTYLEFEQTTGAISSFTTLSAVSQSSGTAATVAQMNDLSFTTGALTTSMVNAWVSVDMGSVRVISYVDLAARSNVANLNARRIQISLDGTTWKTVVSNIVGASLSALRRYSFTPDSARYVRIINPASTAGIVGVSEFVPETISRLIVAPAQGNAASLVVDLPFPMSFKGVNYTKFSANSNGLLRLGATRVTTLATNNVREVANFPKLFAYWTNLSTATLATNGGVRYWSEGVAPSRITVVDWRVNNAASTSGAVNMNFQIKFYEATGDIEYVYGTATTATSNAASIGMATSTVDFISILSLGSPAIISYHNFNNAITNAWPGNGTAYRFAIASYPNVTTVPGIHFPSLENAIGALNWAGIPPAGGTTINVSGTHTEIVPNAITVAPTVPAGLLLRTSGSQANPIVLDGKGATLTAGSGNFNWDYVLGLAGTDYVTVTNFLIRENTSSNSTNLLRAEIGIGLFKKQYNTTLGNDGCHFVTISNNDIGLTRQPNNRLNSRNSYGGNGTREVYYSRGIYACRWNNTHTSLPGGNQSRAHNSRNLTQGIKSQADVHSNNTIVGNTIDDCSLGIEWDDNYLLSGVNLFAGENNVIGAASAGNTITNWGPVGTVIYTGTGNTNGGTYFAGISSAGQKNFTIEHNTIGPVTSETSTSSAILNYAGIFVGRSQTQQATPMRGNTNFFIKVNNNTIQGIDASVGINNKTAHGILFFNGYLAGNVNAASYAVNGPIEVRNNTITNLRVINGKVAGIGTYMKTYSTQEPSNITSISRANNWWFTTSSATINNNTITNINKNPTNVSGASYGLTSAIQWNMPVSYLSIDSNTIGGAGTDEIKITTAGFINGHNFGLRVILVDMNATNYTNRDSLSISNNTIINVNRVSTANITSRNNQRSQGASAIYLGRGAIINTIHRNTIEEMTLANGLYAARVNESIDVIKALGIPRAGASTLHITDNSISSIARDRFGFLSTMATGSGLNSYSSAITADYTAAVQVKNISGNTIAGMVHNVSNSTTSAQSALFYSQLYGIRVRGRNALQSTIAVFDNSVQDLSGQCWNNNGSFSRTSINQYTTAWNVVGINVADYHQLSIYNNEVCNITTSAPGGTTATHALAYGVVGISFGKSSTGASVNASTLGEAVYNNFIGDLSTPELNSPLAVQGIYYWGYGRFARIVHNTIVLGNPEGGTTGRLSSTTSASTRSFGVSGMTFNNAYWNNKSYRTFFSNNVISINATPKGSTTNTLLSTTTTGGFATAWRHYSQSSFKRAPLGIDPNSGGNVYYINDDFRNFVYAQGVRYWTSTNGIRNAFGYWLTSPPANYASQTIHSTRHIKNDINIPNNFNEVCGLYKSFWGIFQRGSFLDLDATTFEMLPLPFENSGSSCSDKYKIKDNSFTYIGSSEKYKDPLFEVGADFFDNTRGADVLSGAYEEVTKSITAIPANYIKFEYPILCDVVCGNSQSMDVKIIAPKNQKIYDIGVDGKSPRLYYRRVLNNGQMTGALTDNNVMVNAANNTATGIEGWRWVEASVQNGNIYTFNFDESKLRSSITSTPTYEIEYFVIAMTDDDLVTTWTTGDFSGLTCPNSVDLYNLPNPPSNNPANNVPADYDGPTSLDENTVVDRYVVYGGASLTKHVEFVNNGVTYTANTNTTITVCKDDKVSLNAKYFITSLGADEGQFDENCPTEYILQVADNTAFTTNVDTFISFSPDFEYVMPVGIKYFRFWMSCDGDYVANSNTIYIGVTGTDCSLNTTPAIADQVSCVGQTRSITVESSGAASKYFWVVNPYGKPYVNAPTAATTTSRALSVIPTNENESGVWKTYVTNSTGQVLLDQIIKAPDYYDVDNASYAFAGTSATPGNGIAFTTTKFIKLNQLSVVGATGDASATTGWNIQLYGKDGQLIFTQAGASAADNTNNNAVTNVNLTNWFIPPGDYMLVLGESVVDVEPDGALGSFEIQGPLNQPNTSTPTIMILGGVEDLDYSSIDSSIAHYFINWDYQEFCTSDFTTFNYTIVKQPIFEIDEDEEQETIQLCATYDTLQIEQKVIGDGLTYQWQYAATTSYANIAGQTNEKLELTNLQSSNSGNYRLRVEGTCGAAVLGEPIPVIVNANPQAPMIDDVFLCGETLLNLDLENQNTGDDLTTLWFANPNKKDSVFQGDVYKIPGVTQRDTLYAYGYNSLTQCYSVEPNIVKLRAVNMYNIPTSVGEHKANAFCIDNEDWAHYYQDNSDLLILSLKLDPVVLGSNLVTSSWNTTSSDYEVLIGVETDKKHLKKGDPAYVINDEDWYVMRRYWKVNTNESGYTSTSKNIPVKMYFENEDYQNLNTNPVEMKSMTDMIFYKLPHGYNPGSSNHDNAPSIDSFKYSSTPSLNTWTMDSILKSNVKSATFHVTGFSGGGGGAGGECLVCTPLPVTWLDVNAAWVGSSAMVQWIVTDEINNYQFEVLRSFNGVDFEVVGSVRSNGDSYGKVKYSFVDEEVDSKSMVYYKVKQVDYDFKYSESKVVFLVLNPSIGNKYILKLSPNPLTDFTNLYVNNNWKAQNIHAVLVNMNGSQIKTYNNLGAGENRLDLLNVASGVYYLKVSDGMYLETIKVIVNN